MKNKLYTLLSVVFALNTSGCLMMPFCGSGDRQDDDEPVAVCPTPEPIEDGFYAAEIVADTEVIDGEETEIRVDAEVLVEVDIVLLTYTDPDGNTWDVTWDRLP